MSLSKAQEIRKANFADEITFVYPQETIPVSVTGKECDLDCAHCGGHYLRNMESLEKASDAQSCLVSGGCDHSGKVPILQEKDRLKQLANDTALNLHVGLVSESEAKEIGEIAQSVSFDFVACTETIQNVYGFTDVTKDDYLNSYRYLQQYTRVIPHICIGLNGGEPSGELSALSVLSKEKPDALSFIVFIPTQNTDFASKSPPDLNYVVDILLQARIMFPETPIHLGCMRPGGKYRNNLDYWALQAGVNKIVIPAPKARELAKNLGLNIQIEEECCSL